MGRVDRNAPQVGDEVAPASLCTWPHLRCRPSDLRTLHCPSYGGISSCQPVFSERRLGPTDSGRGTELSSN